MLGKRKRPAVDSEEELTTCALVGMGDFAVANNGDAPLREEWVPNQLADPTGIPSVRGVDGKSGVGEHRFETGRGYREDSITAMTTTTREQDK